MISKLSSDQFQTEIRATFRIVKDSKLDLFALKPQLEIFGPRGLLRYRRLSPKTDCFWFVVSAILKNLTKSDNNYHSLSIFG